MAEIVEIPLDQIRPDESMQVRHFDTEDEQNRSHAHVESLVASSGKNWPPVLVRPLDDGTFALLDGFHRYKAARLLGMTSFQAELRRNGSRLTAYAANSQHGMPLTSDERKAYARLLHEQQPDLSYGEIARRVGLHESTISRLFAEQADHAIASPARSKGKGAAAGSGRNEDCCDQLARVRADYQTLRASAETVIAYWKQKQKDAVQHGLALAEELAAVRRELTALQGGK